MFINGEDSIQIECLWDSGSENSLFSLALLPFAISQRPAAFKIETLISTAAKPEVVQGVEAVFQVAIPGGEVVLLNLMQHSGLATRNMKLKPKLLTCSRGFAQKHDLKRKGLTKPCPKNQHCHMRPQARLSVILGMDVEHWAPHLSQWVTDNICTLLKRPKQNCPKTPATFVCPPLPLKMK